MKITTEICKKAIVKYCKVNAKEIMEAAFGEYIQEDAVPMFLEKNWKREGKRVCEEKKYDLSTYLGAFKEVLPEEVIKQLFIADQAKGGLTKRSFDCRPYDSQLRAYVYDDGEKIVKINVQGE